MYILFFIPIMLSAKNHLKSFERSYISSKDEVIINNNVNIVENQRCDSIIGTWDISKSISTKVKYKNGVKTKIDSEIVCNVCPTIIFKSHGVGILRNAAGEESSFCWLINKNNIFFSFNTKSDEVKFFTKNKRFNVKIYRDSFNYYLELFLPQDNFKYILIR